MIHLHSVVIKAPAGCAKYPVNKTEDIARLIYFRYVLTCLP